ncbi:MAG TPA: hypothetical protein VK821_18670 [Dehalococcoidia bacterium]|nr:hypothetical protein [Dehalococcoidia bacterium]
MDLRRISPRRVGLHAFALLAATFAVALGFTLAAPHHADAEGHDGAQTGTTRGWLDGQTVQFFYSKPFFCAQPPSSGASSGCEVGADGTVDPRSGPIPTLFVMTPVGFRPADATLHCPIVGSCINHPSTIDLSRLFGPSTVNAPLPAHSHIVDQRHGGWWELKVVGVTDPGIWDQIVAGKSLSTVRQLQSAHQGHGITGDVDTNTYLFFSVNQAQGQ